MKRSRHSDDEILVLLDEARRGVPVEAICATAHISERTFYRWKKRLDGISPKGLEHLAELEREVARLKRQLTFQKAANGPGPTKLAKTPAPSRPDVGAHLVQAEDAARLARGLGARTGRFSSIRSLR